MEKSSHCLTSSRVMSFAALLAVSPACGSSSTDEGAPAGTSQVGPELGGAADDGAQSRDFASDFGPAVGGTCSPRLAADTFTSAVCSCEDTNVAGYLRTRAFRPGDSGQPERLGGSVGVNRDYITSGYADVGGSFVVAGSRDVAFAGYLKSGEDLRLNPAVNVAGYVEVDRDAWFASAVRAFGRVDIGGDLYMAAGAGFRGVAVVDVAGEELAQAVSVEPPCACAPEQIIDVAALVVDAATNNDNASAGLDVDDLDAVIGIGAELILPSGRFYVDDVAGLGSVTLRVTGKAALFLADDLTATGLFRVELEPGAELDVFIRDNLTLTGAALFGDLQRPGATRVYVGGSGDITLTGASAFTGNLYAPTADVRLAGAAHVDGSLFGKNVIAAGFLSVGYDETIREGGEDCPPTEDAELPRLR